MKKFLIVLLSFSLLFSCKDKKDADKDKTENREKDDYQKKDDDKNSDEKTADFKTDENKTDENENDDTNFSTKKEWPQSERDAFVTSCVREAVKGGNSRSLAQRYCDCMLVKVEGAYPDINEAARLTDKDLEDILSKYRDGCLK